MFWYYHAQYEGETPYLVRRMQGHLGGIPDAEGWYAGCHFWSKLDSDDMNWKFVNVFISFF